MHKNYKPARGGRSARALKVFIHSGKNLFSNTDGGISENTDMSDGTDQYAYYHPQPLVNVQTKPCLSRIGHP